MTVLGADEPVPGEITSVAAAPTSGTTTYPVDVVLDLVDQSLPLGTPAALAVVTSSADDVVTVPTSAVTTSPLTSVLVLADGATSRRQVTLGARGSTRTEITDGLEPGDVVVLAQVDADLPTDEADTTTGGFGGGFRGTGGRGGAGPGRAR